MQLKKPTVWLPRRWRKPSCRHPIPFELEHRELQHMSRGRYFVYLILEDSGAKRTSSPVARSLHPPERGSPRNSNNPLTSSPSPSLISLSRHPHMSSQLNPALDFVQYKATPIKHRSSLDSPTTEMKLFNSQAALSPTWSQPRSFERWSAHPPRSGGCAR